MPKVQCYPGALNQVFMNILGNAIDSWENRPAPKTSPSRRRWWQEWEDAEFGKSILFVGAAPVGAGSANGKFVVIRIRDSGQRLTQKAKSRLFGFFFTTKPVGQGTGLGLSISYQIVVEQQGGSLKCIWEPLQGANFWI
ncbi:ATP-binding protein [Microcoleus sp. herbarium8]|uniref:sensor histidine kinase n=1 Tax=Microcoleus sp. herbarium8 TaxID=3055436 RepID=UPI002FD4475D